jgi:beta-lactamase class A
VGELSDVERRVGGRVGVSVFDTGSGRHFGHREDERFAMCSTFKWVLAAAILRGVDRGQLSLHDLVAYGPSELLEYAPVTREHVGEGAMTIDALARAAVTLSDNTAANLLLSRIGGPPAFTQFCRSEGDFVTRLDRDEPTLNTNLPGDPRDTTTPRAMVNLMRRILCGDVLSHDGRERILAWLRECETGKERLRAGLPGTWLVGDKTGTGAHGAVNDIAIAVPPNGAPTLIAAYLSDGNAEVRRLEAVHADIAKLVARELS